MNTEERRRLRLMEWLVAEGSGLHPVDSLYQDHPNAFALSRDDVKRLEAQGHVTSYFAGGMLAQAEATSEGRSWLEDIQARRADKTARRWACRTGLVQWLDAVDANSDGALTSWDGFFGDVRADFYGEPFTVDEVDAGAAWLRERGLIDGTPIEERQGPVQAYLTSAGLECLEHFGGDVRQYATEQRQAASRGGISIQAGGHVQFAEGEGVNQHIEIHEAARVRLEVSGLIEILRAFGVGETDELAALFEEAIAGPSDDGSAEEPLRRFSDRARTLATKVGNTAATAAITTLVAALTTNAEHFIAAIH